jgi:hypothetical protein
MESSTGSGASRSPSAPQRLGKLLQYPRQGRGPVYAARMPPTAFKRIIVRAVLRDVYPMVMRLIAVPDSFCLSDFDDVFQALLGWDAGYRVRVPDPGPGVQPEQRVATGTDYAVWAREPFLFFVDADGHAVRQSSAGDYGEIGLFDYDYAPGSGEEVLSATRHQSSWRRS